MALDGLKIQTSVMLQSSNQKYPSAQVGDAVRVRVPDIDRGRMDSQNILDVVMDEIMTITKCERKTRKRGIISQQLYTRNHFAAYQKKVISLNGVLSDKTMSLRQVLTAISNSGS